MMSDHRPRRLQRALRQLEHPGGALARQPDAPRTQPRHAIDDRAVLVEGEHVDREAHAPRVHAAARQDPERLSGFEPGARQQPDGARRPRVGDVDAIGDYSVETCVARDEPSHLVLSTSGNSTVTNLIAAGPMVMTQMAGKIQVTSGNTIFTPVFAAASSARWRRLVRSVSEYTRSDWATLVPNLSVWISMVTSDWRSSTPVRSARLRSASERGLPARSSRLISRSSSASSG